MTHDSSMSDSDTFKFLPWAPQYGTGLARPAWVSESDTNGDCRIPTPNSPVQFQALKELRNG